MARDGAKTIRELAQRLGVSHQTAHEYTQRHDWPVRRKGHWTAADVAAARRWQTLLRADRSGAGTHPAVRAGATPPPDPRAGAPQNPGIQRFDPVVAAQVDLLLKTERMKHEKLKREVLEGQLVRRELLDGALCGVAALFLSVLDDLELSLPSRVAGMTPGQIEVELGRVLDAAKLRIADHAEVELKRVEDVAKRLARRQRGRPMAGDVR